MGTTPSDRPRARHRTVAAAWARLALAAAVGAACERQRSAVLVRIETDLTAGAAGEVKGVRVRVAPGSGATTGWRLDTAYPIQVGARGSYELPLRVLVMPLEDDAARVVTVEAWVCDTPSCPTATQPLVEQRAIFSFVAGEQRELLMFLSDVCRGMRCSNLETCRGRVPGCQPARVEASLLPVVGQSSPPRDASVDVNLRPPSCPMESPTCALRIIPAATFTLGADGVPDAEPTRPGISVDAFAIDAHEVTVARFRRYWAAGHSGVGGRALRYPGGVELRLEGEVQAPVPTELIPACNWTVEADLRENYPINCVDWVTAQSFCAWDDGRLPTEAEWELAARGPGGRPLPWGSAPPTDNACLSNGALARSGACPVDGTSFMAGATPEGVWHLIGNVAEFTADAFAPYADMRCWGGAARTNPLCVPESPSPTTLRTVRGDAWENLGPFHAASRGGVAPDGGRTVGFRCVRSITGM